MKKFFKRLFVYLVILLALTAIFDDWPEFYISEFAGRVAAYIAYFAVSWASGFSSLS